MPLALTDSPRTLDDAHAEANPARFAGVILLVLLIRVAVFCTGLAALHVAPSATDPKYFANHPWMAFDARAYHEIATHGYSPDRQGIPYYDGSTFTLIAYFPVVPLVARTVCSIIPVSVDVVLLSFSNLCSLIGFCFLYSWARRIAGIRNAALATLVVATFPGAVSFAAGMTEGPFLMLAAIALWLVQRNRFWTAALVAGIATATRPTGIALAMTVVFYAWWQQAELPLARRMTNFALLSIISFSGIVWYETFLWHRYHTPAAYFQAQTHWTELDHRREASVRASHIDPHSWQYVRDSLLHPQVWNRAIACLILLLTLIGLVKKTAIPRLVFLFPLVVFVMTSLPGNGLRVSSVPRYETAATPLFLLVALWISPPRRKPFMIALLLLQLAVQLYYATLFPRQIWVG
jgi:hypothetical protein